MLFQTRTRRWLTGWLCLAVLLAQLAVAAYACPGWVPVLAPQAPASAAMDLMPDCEGMEMTPGDDGSQQQTLLCKAHCDKDKQSAGAQPLPDLPSLSQILSFPVSRINYPLLEVDGRREGFAVDRGSPRGTPPVYLALLVLRQ